RFRRSPLFRSLPGANQFDLEQFVIRDVLGDTEHVGGLPILVCYYTPQRMDPDNTTVNRSFVGIGSVVRRNFPLDRSLEILRGYFGRVFITQTDVFSPMSQGVAVV